MVKHLPRIDIATVFTYYLHHAKIHLSWMEYLLVPILKPDMMRQFIADYRPILLGNVFKKILNALLFGRTINMASGEAKAPMITFSKLLLISILFGYINLWCLPLV